MARKYLRVLILLPHIDFKKGRGREGAKERGGEWGGGQARAKAES